ncbi:MAG: GAF domain-containing protein, partial [Planctomycetales bacterium]|nr:GAF domain-containing protein [Planctomycetales bacterium]
FCGDELRGVISLLCRDGANVQGAFEVWGRNHRDELGLAASYYAGLERFGLVSQYVKFPRGSGLPGETWVSRFPKLISRLGQSPRFMRAAGAKAEGLATALSIPVMRTALELDSVVMALSSTRAPIARVFEIWARDSDDDSLRICQADYGGYIDLQPSSARLRYRVGEGFAGKAWESGRPQVTLQWEALEEARGDGPARYGLTSAVAIPVFVHTEPAAVVVMVF